MEKNKDHPVLKKVWPTFKKAVRTAAFEVCISSSSGEMCILLHFVL